jgi:hypothetical protein
MNFPFGLRMLSVYFYGIGTLGLLLIREPHE